MAVKDDVRILRQQGEPQYKFRTELILPADIPGISESDVRLVQQRLQTLSPIMEISMQAEQGPRMNSHWYYIKDDDCAEYALTFREYEDGLTFAYFAAWRGLMINPDGTYNQPSYWKRQLVVRMLKKDGTLSRQIILQGSFPNKLSIGDLDYTSSDPQTIDIGMTYDGPKFDTGVGTQA